MATATFRESKEVPVHGLTISAVRLHDLAR